MFSSGSQPGDLASEGGAPRWKQRAIYDAMKDTVAAGAKGVRVARLSVYDNVSGFPDRRYALNVAVR